MTTEFQVSDATCGHCKSTIEGALSALGGVGDALLDLETKRLTIEHGEGVGTEQLRKAIADAGYTAQDVARDRTEPAGVGSKHVE